VTSSNNARRKTPSARTRVRRFKERGRYDYATVTEILDAGVMCHVGFVFEGYPVVIPTLYWRDERRLLLHGSIASRMLNAIESVDVCVTVTHLDAIVLTRSAFHHSANYRSVSVFGRPEVLPRDEQRTQLRNFMDSLFPGRWDELRPLRARELRATRILALPIDEASAKVRHGPPDEPKADREWPAWAGLIPLESQIGPPIPDERSSAIGFEAPSIRRLGSSAGSLDGG